MAPAQPQAGTFWRRAQKMAAASHTPPNSSAPPWPMPVRAIRSRARRRPPSTSPRWPRASGDSAPVHAACAVTANTSPDITERRLPCAASTSSRLEQPRARIMPMPNSAPPMAAPDRLPRVAIWRAWLASKAPASASACVATTAVAKANSHTVSLPPTRLRANSMTAERRQKRERCAKKPKARPISRPASASAQGSPRRSIGLQQAHGAGRPGAALAACQRLGGVRA
jgi:hypothetical protein